MDIEEALNAGHCVDPAREMQLRADVGATMDAMTAKSSVDLVVAFLSLCLRGHLSRQTTDIAISS